ncbi:MAG: DUF4272 domain-containing protein [Polyangiaceae bacterium]|nr:DUF4272 domain-containing protein [Polyangiaceae bacterium]
MTNERDDGEQKPSELRKMKDMHVDWSDVASVRAAIALEEAEGELPQSAVSTMRAKKKAHVQTLMSLEPSERRLLFDRATWELWGTESVNYQALQLTWKWNEQGRHADSLRLFDDLITVPHLEEDSTYVNALYTVQNAIHKLGVDADRARRYLRYCLPNARFNPTAFHNALCVFAELGDRAGALHALRGAARYGHDLAKIAADPDLTSLLKEAPFAEIMACPPEEHPTLLLRTRLAELAASPRVVHHSPRRVAARALALAAVSWRASLPGQRALILSDQYEKTQKEVAAMRLWLRERGIEEELDEREAALFAEPLQSSMTPECIDRSWSIEAAIMLGWALDRVRLPQLQAKIRDMDVEKTLLKTFGLGTPAADALLETASLRSEEEIHRRYREQLTLHWRMEERRVHPDRAVDLAKMIEDLPGLELGAELAGGDLAISNKPLTSASTAKADRVASLAHERYRALAWLIAPAGTRMSAIDFAL